MDSNLLNRLDELGTQDFFSASDLDYLSFCSKNGNEEVRSKVAQLLCSSTSEQAKIILKRLLMDEDPLVRTNACDSISVFADEQILDLLLNIINLDADDLVRCYAVLSARDISLHLNKMQRDKAIKVFEKTSVQESNLQICIAANSGMYCLGRSEKIDEVLSELHNDDYIVRCFAVNTLLDIVTQDNRDTILQSLLLLKETEQTEAVNSTLEYAIEYILET